MIVTPWVRVIHRVLYNIGLSLTAARRGGRTSEVGGTNEMGGTRETAATPGIPAPLLIRAQAAEIVALRKLVGWEVCILLLLLSWLLWVAGSLCITVITQLIAMGGWEVCMLLLLLSWLLWVTGWSVYYCYYSADSYGWLERLYVTVITQLIAMGDWVVCILLLLLSWLLRVTGWSVYYCYYSADCYGWLGSLYITVITQLIAMGDWVVCMLLLLLSWLLLQHSFRFVAWLQSWGSTAAGGTS